MPNQMFENLQETLPETQTKSISTFLNDHSVTIGIPKESTFQENRVPLTPAAVKFLSENGHRIILETGAGRNANFSDHQFSEAGAEITSDITKVFGCDSILKIDPPTSKEIDLMKQGQLLISALQINQLDSLLLKKLMDKKTFQLH